jgi:hypothetical protein
MTNNVTNVMHNIKKLPNACTDEEVDIITRKYPVLLSFVHCLANNNTSTCSRKARYFLASIGEPYNGSNSNV